MLDSEGYRIFVQNTYDEKYNQLISVNIENNLDKVPDRLRLYAQRMAIDHAFIEALIKYDSVVDQDKLWAAIADTHKLHVAELDKYGLDKSDQIDVLHDCLSAHQSWIKSSGHAFERYISSIDNEELQKNEIRFILQKDLTKLVKQGQLSNTPEDIEGLKSWGKDFDLYAIQQIHGETHVFGCIQSKTSIRDRVGRDVGFSQNAMDGLFWSVAITFDGAFLHMPEFIHMVNGGGSYESNGSYPHNGWHGMYAFSGIDNSEGRIYKTDKSLSIFAKHSIAAARQFISDRRNLNHSWIAPE